MSTRQRTSCSALSADGGCLRTRCWGAYLDLRVRKSQEVIEHYVIRFLICTLHQISLGWSHQGGSDGVGHEAGIRAEALHTDF